MTSYTPCRREGGCAAERNDIPDGLIHVRTDEATRRPCLPPESLISLLAA